MLPLCLSANSWWIIFVAELSLSLCTVFPLEFCNHQLCAQLFLGTDDICYRYSLWLCIFSRQTSIGEFILYYNLLFFRCLSATRWSSVHPSAIKIYQRWSIRTFQRIWWRPYWRRRRYYRRWCRGPDQSA